MSQRITVKDVRIVFEQFCNLAGRLGFDTSDWSVQEGHQWQAYRLCTIYGVGKRMGSHPMGDYIGSTAKEAYTWLQAANAAMSATIEVQRKLATC